jgi:hypothetical protein
MTLPTTSNATLTVHLDAGIDPSAGTICQDGNGDELCGADVILKLNGPGLITGFMAAPTGPLIVFDPDPFTPTTELRLNLLTATPPHVMGSKLLGTLTLDLSSASGANPSSVEAHGQVVDAAGRLQSIPLQLIAVPEPSHAWLLASGILGLALLYRLRGSG